MISDPLFWLAAAAAVLFLGVAKGGFTGVGQVATPLLALVIPPLQAAAIILPILLVQDAVSVWAYRRHWDARNLQILIPGATLGIGAAGLLAAHVSEAHVRLALGLIALAFVLNQWFGRRPAKGSKLPGVLPGVFWGGLSGFTSTLAHAGGPPFQIYVLPQRLEKLVLVGTSTLFFAAVNAIKVAPYFLLGQLTTENLATSAALFPLAIATNFLGIWLVRITPMERFYRIIYLLIFVIALELIRAGLVGILAG